MSYPGLDERYRFALDLCRQAGEIALAGFRSAGSFAVQNKGRHDLVTSIDLEIDSLAREAISRTFPEDALVSEESSGMPGRRIWVLDPVDGTQNFARGIAHFAISLAFVEEGEVLLGIVYNPATRELFSARKGRGAFLNDRRIGVSEASLPEDAVVDIGYSTRLAEGRYLALLGGALAEGFSFLQQGSAALGLAQVACGRLEAYMEQDLFIWDVLAGLLLVEEAGGWSMAFPPDATRGHPALACAPAFRETLTDLLDRA